MSEKAAMGVAFGGERELLDGWVIVPGQIVAHVLVLILGPRELGSHPSHTLSLSRSWVSAFLHGKLMQRENTLEAFRKPLAPTLLLQPYSVEPRVRLPLFLQPAPAPGTICSMT